MWKYIPFTFKNLLRNRRRTILTVLSAAVSLFLLGVLLSVYATFFLREASEEQALRLVTRHRVSLTQLLPEFYGERIRKVEGVQEVSVQSWFGGIYIDDRPENMFPRFAMEPDKVFKIFSELRVPPEQLEAFLRDRQGTAVGQSIADRVGLKLGQRITIKGDIYTVDLELVVRAIFEAKDDDSSFFHWQYLQESLPKNMRGLVGIYAIRARSAEDVSAIAREIDDQFRNSPQPTKTEAEAAFVLSFIEQIGNIKLFLFSIAGAVVFTILLVSANTMAMSVRERILEVGVLKTLGFPPRVILLMIVTESMTMGLLGGIAGAGLCYVLTRLIDAGQFGFFGGFILPLWGVPVCLGAALLIGLLSSFIPASIAARTTITEALRQTG